MDDVVAMSELRDGHVNKASVVASSLRATAEEDETRANRRKTHAVKEQYLDATPDG